MSDAVATHELLDRAHEALARRAWREAFDLLTAADASEELAPQDLERLADAADALGDIEAVIDAYERAHAGYTQQGNDERAALTALSLASWYAIKGELAVYRGWRATAERLLEELPEGAGHARLALSRATVSLGEGALDTAIEQAELACEIARRLDDRELEVHGLHLQGRALLRRGEIEVGSPLLDEAMAAAVSRSNASRHARRPRASCARSSSSGVATASVTSAPG